MPLPVFEEVVALDPFSLYPNPGDVGEQSGSEPPRLPQICSNVVLVVNGFEMLQSLPIHGNVSLLPLAFSSVTLIAEQIDGIPSSRLN